MWKTQLFSLDSVSKLCCYLERKMSHSSATGLKMLWSPLAKHFVKKYYVVSGLFPTLKQTGNSLVKQAAPLIPLNQNILILLKSEPKQVEKSVFPLLCEVIS